MNQPLLAENFHAVPLPDFFPERLRRACAGKRIQYRIPASVRERMHVPEDIDTAEWADKYRRVTAIDAYPGPWRNELVPHAVKAMQLTSAPHVRKLYLCWPERSAKTNVIMNAAMRQLDRGIESGNIFWLMPSEHEAKKAIGERVIEALKATPRTARLLSRYADDTTRTIIRFRHGPRLFAAWAGSAASVSSFFGALNIADEIDKVDTTGVGKETDILTLLFKRGRDRDDSKFLIVSTPAQGYIYKGTMGAQQVLQYHGKCPHCDMLVNPGEDHIIIPDGASAEEIAHGKSQVSLACPACGSEWSEHDRANAYNLGDWVIIQGEQVSRPETVGMHMTAYLLPTIPLEEISEAIVRARTGGEVEKKALENGYNCKDYESEAQAQRAEDQILRLVDADMPRAVVPRETSTLIALADTQQVGFMYQIVAFAWGSRLRAHLVDHGYVENFDDLKALGEQDWTDAAGNVYRCRAGFIDSGGGTNPYRPKHTRTVEVYDFCRLNRMWRPLKGQRRDNATPWEIKRQDFYPTKDGKKKPIPGGLKRYNIDVTLYKNRLADKLNLEPGSAGSISLHAGLMDGGPHSGQRYAAQLCAEYQDDRGYWECPKGKANHFWDTWVYAFAAADILGVSRKKKPVPEVQEQPEKPALASRAAAPPVERQLPSWRR